MNLRLRHAKWWIYAALTLLLALTSVARVQAHEVRPALLKITEQEPGWFEVTWKVPVLNSKELNEQFVANLLDRYEVVIEEAPADAATTTAGAGQ